MLSIKRTKIVKRNSIVFIVDFAHNLTHNPKTKIMNKYWRSVIITFFLNLTYTNFKINGKGNETKYGPIKFCR